MSELVRARVEDHLVRLRMRHVAQRIDAMLSEAARSEPTYLDFLDGLLREEVDSKQRKRVQMGLTIAHFPQARTLEDFDFTYNPQVPVAVIRDLATLRTDAPLFESVDELRWTGLTPAFEAWCAEVESPVLLERATALTRNLARRNP